MSYIKARRLKLLDILSTQAKITMLYEKVHNVPASPL